MRARIVTRVLVVVATVLGLVLAASAALGWYVSREATELTSPATTSGPAESSFAFVAEHRPEHLEIPSRRHDHEVPATVMRTNAPDRRGWMVLVHGLGGTRTTTYPWAEYFLDRGFDVLAYDQRASGENTAPLNTFGVREKDDLVDALDWIEDNGGLDEDDFLGVWGTSFGGITSALAMAHGDVGAEVDLLVLDSPVATMREMVGVEVDRRVPVVPTGYTLTWADAALELRLGFGFEDADAPAALAATEDLPRSLVIAGTGDTLTPPHMGADIAAAIGAERAELWQPAGVGHVEAWATHHAEYVARLDALVERATRDGASQATHPVGR